MNLSKSLLMVMGVAFCLASCARVDERRGGGGAYDESAFARGMDANNPAIDEGHNRSYGGWRSIDE